MNDMQEGMKILHIWNTAGVASIIAKYMDKLFGTVSSVVMRKRYDKFGLTTYGELWDYPASVFKLRCLIRARKFDIIHIHSCDELVPSIRRRYPEKRIVLHYHGTDVRGRWREKEKFWRKADLILVSTPDLLAGAPEQAVYLPNPVDLDLFKPIRRPSQISKHKKLALYFIKPKSGRDLDWAKEVAKKYDLSLVVHERNIPYTKLPEFLNNFEYYIDRHYIKSLSKTALEALACGVKVIDWREKVLNHFPEEHHPKNTVERLYEMYRHLMESG